MSNTLTIALTHAISFLTRPLVPHHTPQTIDKLHTSLEVLLTSVVRPTWPASYTLAFSPSRLPHPAIWKAANAARVTWSEWIALLGGFEFELVLAPSKVSVRIAAWGAVGENVIWEDAFMGNSKMDSLSFIHSEDEDEIFELIDRERKAGPGGMAWMTPVVDRFPINVHRPTFFHQPSSIISRPSSRSSSSSLSSRTSSSLFSDIESLSSASSLSIEIPKSEKRTRSRRSRPKVTPEVYIDMSKKDVTNYDGGKTTVLTGGVMLGSGSARRPQQRW